VLDGSIPRGEIERMIDRSYGLVVKSLKKAERTALEVRFGKDAIYR
jgi:predicted DNA-binding protein (MmcQ/YjbR family)